MADIPYFVFIYFNIILAPRNSAIKHWFPANIQNFFSSMSGLTATVWEWLTAVALYFVSLVGILLHDSLKLNNLGRILSLFVSDVLYYYKSVLCWSLF
jgi:hypothetical protein